MNIKDPDMYELIGSIKDLYIYNNKFDVIFAMYAIYLYSRRQNIKLCLNDLKKWRESHNRNNLTEEILECIMV